MRRFTLFKLAVTIFLLLTRVIGAVGQLPTANFTASVTSGCTPLAVYFTDLSTGNPFSWNWDFGNGQLSTQQNPGITFYNPGTYTIRLIVKNSAGIDDEVKTAYITVLPSPHAAFSSNLTIACAPGTVQFTDQSTSTPGAGSITGWIWNFGDGTTSTQQNPAHTYTTTGYFTVGLTITSSSGCQADISIGRYVRIISGIDVNFNWSQPGSCQAPYTMIFHDQSNGPGNLSYLWNFGNGGPTSTLQNPSATYASGGTFPVTLQVNSSLGCTGTLTKNVPVNGKTTDFNAPAVVCAGQTVNFQNNSSPAPVSSFWNFGDGTTSSQINPIKMFLTPGTFAVKMINNYGNCKDSLVKNITVTNSPPVNFTAVDSTSCQAPFTVHFTDLSPAASSWIWDFGDSTTSTQQNPTHIYTNPGSYTVTLTIVLPGGCTGTISKQQFIKIAPATIGIANIPNGGCIPYSYSPVAIVNSVDSIVSYSWNLGEPGANYNVQYPTHVYNSVGAYTITLSVVTQTGCTISTTVVDAVRTGTKPTVNFTFSPNNVCASTAIQFTDQSVTTPGMPVAWSWQFGDGDVSGQQNPSHVYQDTGSLSVTLVVANNGCKDSISKQLTVLPPVAKFGYRVNCNNRRQVTFLDSSLVNPAFGPVTYQWRMGDPANTIFNGLPPPTFTYPAFGTFTATLIVTNGACTYQSSRQIFLSNTPPSFTIDKNPVCKSQTFHLTAVVPNPSRIKYYTWIISNAAFTARFDDTTQTIGTSLPTYGQYNVRLITEDLNGCKDTATISNFITVGGPIANFTNAPGACINGTIAFADQSIPPSAIHNWTWNYGDGTQQPYTSPPFTHTYHETGSFTVSLMIRDSAGCADTLIRPSAVLITDPIAAFTADTVYCPLAPLQFTDTSSGVGLAYVWNFGDGVVSTIQNPLHSFPNGNDFYTIQLQITDAVGCRDTITKPNYIHIRRPQSAFSMLDSTGICLPTVISFTFLGKDYESFYWDFDDGSQTTSQNPSHFYNSYGTYHPKLLLTGPGGCVDTAQKTVRIYDPVSTDIVSDSTLGCYPVTTHFALTTPPGFQFKLYFGDGEADSSQQLNVGHTYAWPGNYSPYIILLDNYGCEASKYGAPIHVYGALPIFALNKKEFCDSGRVFFINKSISNDPIISTIWNFGDGNTSTLLEPDHIFSPPNTYIISLTLTTQQQCVSIGKDTVRIYPTPQLSINGRDTVCLNTAAQFGGILALPDSTIKWSWQFGNGDSSHIQNGVVTYSGVGNFNIHLTVVNKLGCTDSASRVVNVVPLPTAVAVSDPVKIISGATAQLSMNYTGPIVSYNWKPAQTLSCATCPVPGASPRVSTKYTVDVVDRFGCTNEGFVTVNVVCNGENFFVPNSFSPNGDGVNDIFYLRGSGLFRVKTLRIFDRWGEVVFEKTEVPVNNPAFGWDGKYKGVPAQPGVYIYQLEILCNNGELLKYSGNVALML